MAKKKDATQDKGVSDKDKNLNPDTQEEEEAKIQAEKEAAEAEAKAKEEAEKTPTDEHFQSVEDIAERVEKDREEELGSTEEKETEEEVKAREEKEAEETEATKGAEEAKAKEEAEAKEKAELEAKGDTVEITVDGVKKTVPKSQVTDAGIRALQKESAADSRLEEAVKLLKEAKQVKKAESKKEKTADEELADLGVDKKKISELREAIQYGEEEDATAAIEEMIRLGRGGKPEIPEGLMTIEEYEKLEKKKEENKIIEKFSLPPDKGGFSDIIDDPYLFAAHDAEVKAELRKGTPNTWELYESAGKKVREWRGTSKSETMEDVEKREKKEAADQKAKDELAEKREKKAKAAGTTVAGVNAKTETTKKKEAPEETVSDIITEMREARKQPV